MSAEWVKGKVVFTCDACDDTLETDTDDFRDARVTYKIEGWVNYPIESDKWENRCPLCK